MFKQRPVVSALCLVLVGAGGVGVLPLPVRAGQVAAPPAKVVPPASNSLDILPYDASTRGPLLLVGKPNFFRYRSAEEMDSIKTVSALAEALRLRVVPLGTLTVLAPSTMRVIVENPGKPDAYAGLRADERFKILLSQFSTAQWETAGSARGIGLADMNEAQRALFIGLLPETMSLRHVKLVPTDKPFTNRYEDQGSAQNADPLTARLRLVRKVQFHFSKTGAEDSSVRSAVEPSAGDEITLLEGSREAREDVARDAEADKAFGVSVFQTLPNRLKSGQINFDSDALRATVALDVGIKTLADLLARVAQTTKLDLVADKRIAGLSVSLRVARGQGAHAGDILRALCWSVTGAFRRVGASTYLLTDDVQGIGARFARLSEWAQNASNARSLAMQELTSAAVKHNPLAHVHFAPGDPYALPPALEQRVDASYRRDRGSAAPIVRKEELPPALQQSIERDAQFWEDNHIVIRTDRIELGTELSAQFVLPGGEAVEPFFSQNIGGQYLERIAAPAPTLADFNRNAAPPRPMPPTLHRRILLARLPDDDKALVGLLALTKAKGFREIWLRVRLDDATATGRLKAAVTAGKKAGLAVGAVCGLLHDGGIGGAEDINILGETGTQYATRRAASADKNMREYYQRMAGWTLMNEQEAGLCVASLARIAGLSALALNATRAPGWEGPSVGGDGIPDNGYLGYGVSQRLAFLRAEGADPIDVVHYGYSLPVRQDLPFFAFDDEALWKTLHVFRQRINQRAMISLHTMLRQAAPALPLYVDDRISSYADANTRWYARWDAAERLPVNPVYSVPSEARAAAFASSSEPLLCLRGWSGTPSRMAQRFSDTAQAAAKGWRGVTLDLTPLAPTEALRMLAGLPDDGGDKR